MMSSYLNIIDLNAEDTQKVEFLERKKAYIMSRVEELSR
jgi:hypothetical protein